MFGVILGGVINHGRMTTLFTYLATSGSLPWLFESSMVSRTDLQLTLNDATAAYRSSPR